MLLLSSSNSIYAKIEYNIQSSKFFYLDCSRFNIKLTIMTSKRIVFVQVSTIFYILYV